MPDALRLTNRSSCARVLEDGNCPIPVAWFLYARRTRGAYQRQSDIRERGKLTVKTDVRVSLTFVKLMNNKTVFWQLWNAVLNGDDDVLIVCLQNNVTWEMIRNDDWFTPFPHKHYWSTRFFQSLNK